MSKDDEARGTQGEGQTSHRPHDVTINETHPSGSSSFCRTLILGNQLNPEFASTTGKITSSSACGQRPHRPPMINGPGGVFCHHPHHPVSNSLGFMSLDTKYHRIRSPSLPSSRLVSCGVLTDNGPLHQYLHCYHNPQGSTYEGVPPIVQ